jgi:hypothetical protein
MDKELEKIIREKEQADVLQLVKEWSLANPPEIECQCAALPRRERMRVMKRLAKQELERFACLGIKSWADLNKFLGVVALCIDHRWISHAELQVILVRVIQMIDGEREGKMWMWDCGGEALEKLCGGLSKRIC